MLPLETAVRKLVKRFQLYGSQEEYGLSTRSESQSPSMTSTLFHLSRQWLMDGKTNDLNATNSYRRSLWAVCEWIGHLIDDEYRWRTAYNDLYRQFEQRVCELRRQYEQSIHALQERLIEADATIQSLKDTQRVESRGSDGNYASVV